MKNWDTVAIVGVGLIGASIGLALRDRKLAREVVGIGRRASTLRTAKRRGAVTRTTTDIAAGVKDAQLVVVCTPVEIIVEQARAAILSCREGAFITDAGSTKEEIVFSLDHALAHCNPRRVAYVGSHPMAGSEKNGPQHATADLFAGKVAVVTPSSHSIPQACRTIAQFWRSLGSRVVRVGAKEHDQAVAAISHLPHLVASALAAATSPAALPLAAGGWHDTTRIAASDPRLWQQILSQNRFNVLQTLDVFSQELAEFRRALTYNDRSRIEQLLEKGKTIRQWKSKDGNQRMDRKP
jgi:prephenate dehydrogenase